MNMMHRPPPGPHCLGYWIGRFDGNNVLHQSNCLKIQPTWMSDKRDVIQNIPLSKLLLPGTHDSGSFYGDSIIKGNELKKFIFTQDQDIWNQLVYGVRYLDIRVGYYPDEESDDSEEESEADDYNEENFWINHDLIKVRKLRPILLDVKHFVEIAKDEIVIVDVHRLPVGFYLINGALRKKRHEKLINLLLRELGDLAVDYTAINQLSSRRNMYLLDGPRMIDIWESGKRIIVCYPDNSLTRGSWLWPPLTQKWGNRQSVTSLKEYITDVMASDPPNERNPLWAVMAQMTPRALDIIFNPKNDLLNMANSVNRNLTRWVRDNWIKTSNIIASDFFMGNDLIELSIKSAVLKAVNPVVEK